MTDVSIVIPTYNECENITEIVTHLAHTLSDIDYELIVVDDGSPDGTAEVAEELCEKYPVRVVRRRDRGLASAILTGFDYAKGEILGVLDADGQHPPGDALQFIRAIDEGNDIVLGSRYVDGGGIDGWTFGRKLMSKGAIALAKPLLAGVRDPISGYFFIRRAVIENVQLKPTGYKLGLEILVKGRWSKVKEIPITFRMRKKGESKVDSKEIYEYIHLLLGLYIYRIFRAKREEREAVENR